jgi:chemotaxis response regulator CheB
MNIATTTSLGDLRSVSVGAVTVVASAGGLHALFALLGALPGHFPMPIFIAQHLARRGRNMLPELLMGRTGFATKWAEWGEMPRAGMIYCVPPGESLQIGSTGILLISQQPDTTMSWFRATDNLLESVSRFYQADAIGVVLSGMLPAGLRGLRATAGRGGIVMAQNQMTAEFFAMPLAAADEAKADIVFSPEKIAEALAVVAESRMRERNISAAVPGI